MLFKGLAFLCTPILKITSAAWAISFSIHVSEILLPTDEECRRASGGLFAGAGATGLRLQMWLKCEVWPSVFSLAQDGRLQFTYTSLARNGHRSQCWEWSPFSTLLCELSDILFNLCGPAQHEGFFDPRRRGRSQVPHPEDVDIHQLGHLDVPASSHHDCVLDEHRPPAFQSVWSCWNPSGLFRCSGQGPGNQCSPLPGPVRGSGRGARSLPARSGHFGRFCWKRWERRALSRGLPNGRW